MKTIQFTPTELAEEARIEERFGAEPRRPSFIEIKVREETSEYLRSNNFVRPDGTTDWEAKAEWARIALDLCRIGSGKGSWE